jgi:hypothetical protein
VRANEIAARTPNAASHSTGPAEGRKPMSIATPTTIATHTRACTTLPMT